MGVEINYSETSGPNIDAFIKGGSRLTCFIPICSYSFMANRNFLHEYLRGVLPRCFRAIIITGDYLERHNIMAFDHVSETKATDKTEKKGRKIKRTIASILEDLKPESKIQVESCRVYIDHPDGQKITRSIRNYCEQNSVLKNDIEDQVHLMLNSYKQRTLEGRLPSIDAGMMNQLREYLIEELTFYILLYQRGFSTEIYPGRDMKVLRNLAMRKYPDFPFDLSERTHISIAVLLDSGAWYARLDENNEQEGE